MDRLVLLNKPFQVMCQFSREGDRATLADYISIPDIYPAGRLDYDSEGLVILTNSGRLQHRITDPRHKLPKTYLAQVEGIPVEASIDRLRHGVMLKDGGTRPAEIELIDDPELWPRNPPIRVRRNIPSSWLRLTISEGRNRQVRRMTAAVGHPTLRLIRVRIGEWELGDLLPGQWREVPV